MCGFFVDTGSGMKVDALEAAAGKIQHRGPDATRTWQQKDKVMIFHRLAIMDRRESGMQPFEVPGSVTMVCNGEIYNEPELKRQFVDHFSFQSNSDCEVLLPMYLQHKVEAMSAQLDAEFALVGYDHEGDFFFASRDPIGIRPLFYGHAKTNGAMMFASEAKSLQALCEEVKPFPPGKTYRSDTDQFEWFCDPGQYELNGLDSMDHILEGIRVRLEAAVEKRLRSDAPVGFLLSGGLDSSLVCAIGRRILGRPITTFSVGIDVDPIDLGFAKQVADDLGCDHHEVRFTKEEVFEALSELIYHLETFDITTIRASVGMYLVCKYVREKTDVKVLMTGEVSDELFGYKYTDFAPTAADFQEEAQKRVRELYAYDVLRADRCISAHGLEARVPFGDLEFVDFVMGVAPELKMNHHGIGKYLLRKAFDGLGYLQDDILYREKAAFSDAVGHSMVDELKLLAEDRYSEEDLIRAATRYPEHSPISKESLMYRDIFETYYPGRAAWIPGYWMPNASWENCAVDDPSARALPNYGQSGDASQPDRKRQLAV